MHSEPGGGWRAGIRAGVPLGLAAAALAVTFGAYATLAGWPPAATILMSALVFSGSAEFASITAASGGACGTTGSVGAWTMVPAASVPMAAVGAWRWHLRRLPRGWRARPWRRSVPGAGRVPDGTTAPAKRRSVRPWRQRPGWALGHCCGRAPLDPRSICSTNSGSTSSSPASSSCSCWRPFAPARPSLGRPVAGDWLGRRTGRAGRRRPLLSAAANLSFCADVQPAGGSQ